MRHFQEGRFRSEVRFLRRQFLQDEELPFTDVLTESSTRSSEPVSAKDIAFSDPAVSLDILDFTARVLVAPAVDTELSSLEPSPA